MSLMMNIVNQLNVLYNKKMEYYKVFKNVDLFFPIDTIGNALNLIYVLDCIVKQN
jgi:hypothetical protein